MICSRTLRISYLEITKGDIVPILSKLETIYTPAFFDIMVHLVMHFLEETICGGAVHLKWIHPFECFLSVLKKYVRNRVRPEGSIAKAYIINEALTFYSMYLSGIETRFNRVERNWIEAEDNNIKKISVFNNQYRPIRKMTPITLENHLRNKAEWYIE